MTVATSSWSTVEAPRRGRRSSESAAPQPPAFAALDAALRGQQPRRATDGRKDRSRRGGGGNGGRTTLTQQKHGAQIAVAAKNVNKPSPAPRMQGGSDGNGRGAASVAPPFVSQGWLYPAGLNRRQRRAVNFLGRDDPEVRSLAVCYVGNEVMDGIVMDESAELLAQPRNDSPAPPSLQVTPTGSDKGEATPPPSTHGEVQQGDEEEWGGSSSPGVTEHDSRTAGDSPDRGSGVASNSSSFQADEGDMESGNAEQQVQSLPAVSDLPQALAEAIPPPPPPPPQQDDITIPQVDVVPVPGSAPGVPLAPPEFTVGDRVVVRRKARIEGGDVEWQNGTVKYIGFPDFTSKGPGFDGEWVGVELDTATGTHDGEIDGVRYFCAQAMHGVFVRRDKIIPSTQSAVSIPNPAPVPQAYAPISPPAAAPPQYAPLAAPIPPATNTLSPPQLLPSTTQMLQNMGAIPQMGMGNWMCQTQQAPTKSVRVIHVVRTVAPATDSLSSNFMSQQSVLLNGMPSGSSFNQQQPIQTQPFQPIQPPEPTRDDEEKLLCV